MSQNFGGVWFWEKTSCLEPALKTASLFRNE